MNILDDPQKQLERLLSLLLDDENPPVNHEWDGQECCEYSLNQEVLVLAKTLKDKKKPNLIIGTLYPSHNEVSRGEPTAMWLHQQIGTAKAEDGRSYMVASAIPHGSIIIRSNQTGRSFVVTAEEVLKLAIKMGVDSTDPIPNPLKEENNGG